MNETADEHQSSKLVCWAVTLGYNNWDDTLECLESLGQSRDIELHTVYVDNDSRDGSAERVAEAFPGTHVLQTGANLGFARGFNVGLDYALSRGADWIFMVNNDTALEPDGIARLIDEAKAHPEAGILVPKILYYDARDCVWAAGSRFRRFPPSIVMRKTAGPDDGRYDGEPALEFATTCALLLTRSFLQDVGLLDADFFILYDDYDWSLRARDAGFSIRLVPGARLYHKVSKSTGVGTRSPFFWTQYGRSTALFFRKHRNRRWMTGSAHLLYLLLRMVAERKPFGVRPFLTGYREGLRMSLSPPPRAGAGEADPFTRVDRGGHRHRR